VRGRIAVRRASIQPNADYADGRRFSQMNPAMMKIQPLGWIKLFFSKKTAEASRGRRGRVAWRSICENLRPSA
jgi:hypothetical protein